MDRGGDNRWPEIRRGCALSNGFNHTQTPLIPSEVEGQTHGWACPSTSLGMSGVGVWLKGMLVEVAHPNNRVQGSALPAGGPFH